MAGLSVYILLQQHFLDACLRLLFYSWARRDRLAPHTLIRVSLGLFEGLIKHLSREYEKECSKTLTIFFGNYNNYVLVNELIKAIK